MEHSRKTRTLHDGWVVTAQAGPIPNKVVGVEVPAKVPGCVHSDLLAGGLIPDPFLDSNEALTAWIGQADWTYRTAFFWEPDGFDHAELVFEGLDTVADVAFNGASLGRVDNMHRTWRFGVTTLLRPGANELTVSFRSPVAHAAAMSFELGMRPTPYPAPYNAIRKMAASFGWDWGLSTATSGIWRPVRLECWSTARLGTILLDAQPDGADGRLRVRVSIDDPGDEPLGVQVEVGGVRAVEPVIGEAVELELVVPDAELWWPTGFGAPTRYPVEVTLVRGDAVLDWATRSVGFRSVRWDSTPDADGTPFQLVVNQRPVWVRGVNWIPDDALITRVDAARLRARVGQAAQANVNLIRVWGGGVYEDDEFFEVCDELGIMVWQDFLFACAAYSEDADTWRSVEAEARDNVARLAHHPSLVLWNGSNENLQGYEEWDWPRMLAGADWGLRYYNELLPAVVAELSPGVPYIPSSPFSPGGESANAELHGTMHIWDMWNRRDWPGYRGYRPRFVTEFGWQGPPSWTTLVGAIHDDPLTPESPGMITHQKAFGGNVKLTAGLVPHFEVPRDFEDWHWAMQLNQASAVGVGVNHFRSLAPHNSGAVVWQLNDCWPVTSWAAIDYAGVRKPLWYALQNAFADRVVIVEPDAGGLVAAVVNDSAEALDADLNVRRLQLDGRELAAEVHRVSVAPRGVARVALGAAVVSPTAAGGEVLVAEASGARGVWAFAGPRASLLRAPEWSVKGIRAGDDLLLTLTPDTIALDVCLLVDKLDPAAYADRGMFTVLPGETVEVRIVGGADLKPGDLASARVLRSAGQLV